jgi:hypothetical protein
MHTKAKILGGIAAVLLTILASTPATVADELADMKAEMARMAAKLEKMQAQMNEQQFNQIHKEELTAMMQDILDDAKAQPALPSWMENLKFYGDLRFRFQSNVTSWRDDNGNDIKNRNRLRTRLRFGFTKTWWDKQMEVGFRLATGGSAPDSANESWGSRFDKKPVWVDLAYAKYAPKCVDGLEITAGKMKNPIKSTTKATWDGDINPEGIHVSYVAPFFGDFKPYAGFGYWVWALDQDEQTPDNTIEDMTYWTYELGFDWKIMKDLSLGYYNTLFAHFRHFNNTETSDGDGPYNSWDSAANPDRDFLIYQTLVEAKWKMAFMPGPFQKWKAWFSWSHNCRAEYPSNQRFSGEGHDNAYVMGVKAGDNKKKGDISASFEYRWIGLTSLLSEDGFGWPDSDFANGVNTTNVKGWVVGTKYNLDDFLTIGGKLIVAEPISSGSPYTGDFNEDSTCVVQVDMVWKF